MQGHPAHTDLFTQHLNRQLRIIEMILNDLYNLLQKFFISRILRYVFDTKQGFSGKSFTQIFSLIEEEGENSEGEKNSGG